MNNVLHIATVSDYYEMLGEEMQHPLVGIIDFSKIRMKAEQAEPAVTAVSFGFYMVFLKEDKNCHIRYGRNYYDYQAGTLVFFGPGQVVSVEAENKPVEPKGYALFFHPDLLRGTPLAQHMKLYSFFSYDVHEALHLSGEEKQIILDGLKKVGYELGRTIDKHSRNLISANIELILSYCMRFYDRQFITRNQVNSGIVERFDTLLNEYIASGKAQYAGIPTVAYLAAELNLSANYLGDLIKKETGKTAQEQIQIKLLQIAKEKIFEPNRSVREIAYELGFAYPQHFTRFFKQHSGYTPNDFKKFSAN